MPIILNKLGWGVLSLLSLLAIRKFINYKRKELGLGPGSIIPKKIKTKDLADAFNNFTSGKYTKNVKALSEKMKNEDGVNRSVEIITEELNSIQLN